MSKSNILGDVDRVGRDIEPSSMTLMIEALSEVRDLPAVSDRIVEFNTYQSYENVHMGICKINGLPVKDVIHDCPISELGMSANDFEDEVKAALCKEAEYLLRPFDILTHPFRSVEISRLNGLRKRAKKAGLKQIIVMPFRIKNTIIVTIMNFPNGDFEGLASEILPQLYQLTLTLFDNFPQLLTWPKVSKLTLREIEILSLSATGLTEAAIAQKCGISINTVRNHVENSKLKLNARNKLHAVMIASKNHELD